MSCAYFLGKKSSELYHELTDIFSKVQCVKVGQKLTIHSTSVLIGEYARIDQYDLYPFTDCDQMKTMIYRVRANDWDVALLFEDRQIISIYDLIDQCEPCAPLQSPSQPIQPSRMSILLVIVIIFIILLLAWALLYVGPRG